MYVTRADGTRHLRPELLHGAVEYVAGTEYQVHPPVPPIYCFLLDVSRAAVQSGVLAAACQGIRDALADMPAGGDGATKVALLTVDSHLHLYQLRGGLRECVLADPDDLNADKQKPVRLPQTADLVAPLTDVRPMLDRLLADLPNRYAATFNTGCAFGAALKCVGRIMVKESDLTVLSLPLQEPLAKTIACKVVAVLASLPSVGIGALTMRDNAKLANTPNEVQLLRIATDVYHKIGLDFQEMLVGLDMLCFTRPYADVATLCMWPASPFVRRALTSIGSGSPAHLFRLLPPLPAGQ